MSHWHRNSIAVLGVPFDNVTMHEAVGFMEKKIEEEGFHQVATANVDFVMNAIHDKGLQEMLCACDLIVPDGMPIVWAARLMGAALKERVAGADLVPHLAELCARRGYGMYLLGASEESSSRAAQILQRLYPALRIVGRDSPPVTSLEQMDHDGILTRIEMAKPHVLLVAMGHPKQERWLAMHRDRLRIPLCMGVGGSLDFLGGTVSRAPVWMQTAGFEWLYRAIQEPERLGKRYLNDAYGLARHLPKQLAAVAVQPRKRTSATVQTRDAVNALVISIAGDLGRPVFVELSKHLLRANERDQHVILDLAKTSYVGPDTLGSLLHVATRMKSHKRQLWVAGAQAHLLRVLRATRVRHCFLTASTVDDAIYRITKGESRLPAESIAIRTAFPRLREINVRVEMLKDLCERIVAVGQTAELRYGGIRSTSPVTQ